MHPVCSQECKKKHLLEVSSLDGPAKDPHRIDEASLAFTDAQLVFRSIVKICVGADS